MLRSSASYLVFCLVAPLSLSYHNADVIAHKEIEQYCHEDGTDKRPCHNDLLPRGLPNVLTRTPDIEVIQAGIGVRLGLNLVAVLWSGPVTKKVVVVAVVVSHIQRIGCQPEKITLHGGQSRSWSPEQE